MSKKPTHSVDAQEVPVLFLIFNRPDTTEQVFEAIAEAKPSRLFVAADGPRSYVEGDVEKCAVTREIVKKVDWECDVKTLFRDENLGCKKAVSSAIDWFFEHVNRGIILEDDCLPSDSFFSFCSELLDKYADDNRVMTIAGSNFQNGIKRGVASYYFSHIQHIWGWATWRRAWKLFDLEMSQVPDFRESNVIDNLFPDRNVALSWKLAFALARTKKVNSWAYPWVFTCLTQSGLSIIPNRNLVSNIGFGCDSTHTAGTDSIFADVNRSELNGIVHPESICCNENADLYEYIQMNIFPYRENMGLRYRYRRMRRARRFKMKIEKAYEDSM